jgi:hypothetical protein
VTTWQGGFTTWGKGFTPADDYDAAVDLSWDAGYEVGLRGDPVSACSVSPSDPAGASWRLGWLEGAGERRAGHGQYGATLEEKEAAGVAPSPTTVGRGRFDQVHEFWAPRPAFDPSWIHRPIFHARTFDPTFQYLPVVGPVKPDDLEPDEPFVGPSPGAFGGTWTFQLSDEEAEALRRAISAWVDQLVPALQAAAGRVQVALEELASTLSPVLRHMAPPDPPATPLKRALAAKQRAFRCPRHGEQHGGFCRPCSRGR